MKQVILVADDSSTVRKFLSFCLKMNNFTVIMAEDGMDALEKTIDKTRRFLGHEIDILGILVTKFRRGTTLHTEMLEELRTYWKGKVFDTVIHINIDVAAAAVDQLPVVMVKPDCTASQNYITLADEVISREIEQE